MRLSFGQEMRQRMDQRMILAPRMIQSMEILQLPILALQERIEQEMQENPLLDQQEGDSDVPDEQDEVANPDAPTDTERELVVDERGNNESDFERLELMDQEYPDTFDERSRPSSSRMEEDSDRQHDAIANIISRPQTLHDYLHDQLGWFDLDPAVRQMCDRIIYNLDPNGYLQGRLEDVLDPDADPKQLENAKKALTLVQRLDPRGIGARDLRECLLLQLMPGIPLYDEQKTLIANHLEDLEHNRMPVIQKKTGFSIQLIQSALQELRKLNPKPGAAFTEVTAPSVTPDIFVEVAENGAFKVRLEDGRTPNLFISKHYRQLLQSESTPPETREYIKRKINSAQWLIESIEQRRSTLTKVAQAIVDHQHDFLTRGPEFIEPLKMQQIADKVKVHVTTVSRAVDDKWIQTPRGIFPLKRFFVGGTVSSDGEEVAWDNVRLKLQEIINKEDKLNPLSDDDLVAELAKHGLTVARRTITKYRKAMKIPSSRERRDWTKVAEAKAAESKEHRTNGAAATSRLAAETAFENQGESDPAPAPVRRFGDAGTVTPPMAPPVDYAAE